MKQPAQAGFFIAAKSPFKKCAAVASLSGMPLQ